PSDYELQTGTPEQLAATPELDQLVLEDPPSCTNCQHGFIRPDIVLFGEMLPQQAMDDALDTVRSADVALVIGTSTIVQPAASLPTPASSACAKLIDTHPNATPLTQEADFYIQGTARNVLPELYT